MTDTQDIEKRLDDIEYYHSIPNDILQDDFEWLLITLRASLARERIAIEALEFYADKDMWGNTTHESTFDGVPCHDFESFKLIGVGFHQIAGKRAREALKKINEKR